MGFNCEMKEKAPTAKERVEIEVKELEEKLGKLDSFICKNEAFSKLSNGQQFLLHQQSGVMTLYVEILKKRLEIWDK